VIGLERWRAACAALGVTRSDDEHRKLLRAWGGWGRHYHTLTHLEECLRELVLAKDLAERPAEIEVALWFHDAVYRTFRKDNELQSAVWASDFLSANGAKSDCAARVRALVMATAHLNVEFTGDAALIVDIDLSILGASAASYDEFEKNVRKEYWWVPARRYAAARTNILRTFLSRASIYNTDRFRERYEAAARLNMERAIQALAIG
jgi:predicted metal-dependent HD superfamily phosphohydrolase